mmetsp:Transcript_356/g.887  ORF Transcript_356/g.887 Transcript_356/m.887 type:complete len:206 (+) Transcript_356:1028-1645(+)
MNGPKSSRIRSVGPNSNSLPTRIRPLTNKTCSNLSICAVNNVPPIGPRTEKPKPCGKLRIPTCLPNRKSRGSVSDRWRTFPPMSVLPSCTVTRNWRSLTMLTVASGIVRKTCVPTSKPLCCLKAWWEMPLELPRSPVLSTRNNSVWRMAWNWVPRNLSPSLPSLSRLKAMMFWSSSPPNSKWMPFWEPMDFVSPSRIVLTLPAMR